MYVRLVMWHWHVCQQVTSLVTNQCAGDRGPKTNLEGTLYPRPTPLPHGSPTIFPQSVWFFKEILNQVLSVFLLFYWLWNSDIYLFYSYSYRRHGCTEIRWQKNRDRESRLQMPTYFLSNDKIFKQKKWEALTDRKLSFISSLQVKGSVPLLHVLWRINVGVTHMV